MRENLLSEINYKNLEQIEDKIWSLIHDAVVNRDAPFRTPIFSNIEDGKPNARTVVLRSANSNDKNIFFNADFRSPKIKYLKENPQCHLTFYDKLEKIQLRVTARSIIHYQDSICSSAWNKVNHFSRKCYLYEKSPGSEINSPRSSYPREFFENGYTLNQSECGYINFCVIECLFISIDWLYLSAKGHLRASLNYKSKSEPSFTWISP